MRKAICFDKQMAFFVEKKSIMRIQQIKILPEQILLQNLHKAALMYGEYVEKDVLIVYAKNKEGPFYSYVFHAGKENFQHLAGVKYPKGAEYFYEHCLNGTLKRADLHPVENMKLTSSKIEILPEAIHLQAAKIYKIGDKDLVTLKNKFSVAIGNTRTVMGIDKRDGRVPVPVTVMDRSIADFCSVTYSIFLIMTKNIGDEKYTNVLYEKTKGILEKASFGKDIDDIIENSAHTTTEVIG